MILFNSPSFEGHELEYMKQAVIGQHTSGGGPFSQRVETHLEQLHGGGSTLLTTSCTHALELVARLLDLGPADEVIVPAYTFVSTASAFMLTGARPVFVDVRRDTLNISPDAVEAAITPRTRAICAVHYAGIGAEPAALASLAQQHGVALIEDNAHGLFSSFAGRPLGTFGTASTLSFHETKNITCGEGGAIHVNDQTLVERAEILRDKGTNRSRFLRGQVDKYTWVDVGSSWAVADLLAAMLCAQLERSDAIQERRHLQWDRYHAELADWVQEHGIPRPEVPPECAHSAHMYHLRLRSLADRDRFIAHLRSHGVQAVFHYQSLHLSTVGLALGGRPGQFPVTEEASDTLVRLPLHTSLTQDDQALVIEAVLSYRPDG